MNRHPFTISCACRLIPCLFVLLGAFLSCGKEEIEKVPVPSFAGKWRGVLETAGGELPFLLDIREAGDGHLKAAVLNGEEVLPVSIVIVKGDSAKFFFKEYDSYLHGEFDRSSQLMSGHFLRNKGDGFKKLMKFRANRDQKDRFPPIEGLTKFPYAPADISGEWNIMFGEGNDTWEAHAILKQNARLVAGTMLTEVGDFRYLAGAYEKGILRLSVFDGAHCFLFHATLRENEVMKGDFYSGAESQTPWTATRGKNRLRDPYTLTKITNEAGTFSFKFPDVTGKEVSSEDPRFKNKPMVVTIFGTWCPNCHDDGAFLVELYKTYHPRGLEMVSLACEFSGDHKQDSDMVGRFKKKYKISWPVLIVGTSNKKEVAVALPDLSTFLSFPTTLFIDRSGKVQKVHTGFTGPGTGKYYDELKKEFKETIEALL